MTNEAKRNEELDASYGSGSRWDLPKQAYMNERGEEGDCWRCCVAAILQMHRDEVPHFLIEGDSLESDTQQWLNDRGYWLVRSQGPDGFRLQRWGENNTEPPPMIAAGPTVRSKKAGQHHAVVMVGREMAYDPHPSEAGLLAVTEKYLIMPYYQNDK